MRDEARRLAEEMDSVLSGHISSTNCEYFENVLLSFGRIVREEDAKICEDTTYTKLFHFDPSGAWCAGATTAAANCGQAIRELLKTLD